MYTGPFPLTVLSRPDLVSGPYLLTVYPERTYFQVRIGLPFYANTDLVSGPFPLTVLSGTDLDSGPFELTVLSRTDLDAGPYGLTLLCAYGPRFRSAWAYTSMRIRT